MSQIFNVSELVNSIKKTLEGSFSTIEVQGEVSNFSQASSGHIYFTLSDSEASCSCALFRMDAIRNPNLKKIKDGTKIVCLGEISVYAKRGTFQLIVRKINPIGVGDLSEQFELLKKKLAGEGLFDLEKKKKLPEMPKKIAIITAINGAALQDFINIIKRRSFFFDLLILPALVQGEKSPDSLISALNLAILYHQTIAPLDVVVFARGGGSIEDLYSFNDEILARKIAQCPIPTISAVGHQVDFTICDFVADFRAETPSSAAEKLTEVQLMINERLNRLENKMQLLMQNFLSQIKHQVERGNPHSMSVLLGSMLNGLKDRLAELNIIKRTFELLPLHENQIYLDELGSRINFALAQVLGPFDKKIESLYEVLKALDPKSVLNRGYIFMQNEEGQIITNFKTFSKFKKGDKLKLAFSDGVGMVLKDE